MDKLTLLTLHHLAAAAAEAFHDALQDGCCDEEIGRYAREWDQAELRLVEFREEALLNRLSMVKQDGGADLRRR